MPTIWEILVLLIEISVLEINAKEQKFEKSFTNCQ